MFLTAFQLFLSLFTLILSAISQTTKISGGMLMEAGLLVYVAQDACIKQKTSRDKCELCMLGLSIRSSLSPVCARLARLLAVGRAGWEGKF